MSDNKECFFISPIGESGSDARERSNRVMEYIIEEVVSDFGYSTTRADLMDEPGSITNQVIEKTIESELVIADLTGHNPNVFYELAVRHATGEPYIQLIDSTESIPFDISDFRTVQYGLDVAEADAARDEIRSQLESLEEGDTAFDSPISKSAEMQSLRESSDPTDKGLAELMQTVSKLDKKVSNLRHQISDQGYGDDHENISDIIHQVEINGESYHIRGDPVSYGQVKRISRETLTPVDEIMEILHDHNISVSAGGEMSKEF